MKWVLLCVLWVMGCAGEMVEGEDTEMRGWSASGDLTTGQGVNGGIQAVGLQAQLQMEASLTTQFNISGPLQGIANCRAEITSFVAGNMVRRIVSVIDGMTITTRGKNINVRARDFTDPSISAGASYQVAILSTLGDRAVIEQPPILTPLTVGTAPDGPFVAFASVITVPAGASRYVQVPVDAGVNSVKVTVGSDVGFPIVDGDINVIQLSTFAGPVAQAVYDPRTVDWVPLIPNTSVIQLENDAGAPAAAYFAVFFGIDG